MLGQKENESLLKIREYFLKYISKLKLIDEVQDEAIEILDAIAKDSDFLSRSNPRGLAAGITYVAAIVRNDRVTQNGLSEISEMSVSTIRKYYISIAKEFRLHEPRD